MKLRNNSSHTKYAFEIEQDGESKVSNFCWLVFSTKGLVYEDVYSPVTKLKS